VLRVLMSASVGGLVGGGVQVGRAIERDVLAARVRDRADGAGAGRGRLVDVGGHPGHVVVAERVLDAIEVGRGGRLLRADAAGPVRRSRRLIVDRSLLAGCRETPEAFRSQPAPCRRHARLRRP